MSVFDPDERRRFNSGDAGGRWIAGIVVVVLVGLGIWWWAGTGRSGPTTASVGAGPPMSTTGSAPSHKTGVATPAPASPGTAK